MRGAELLIVEQHSHSLQHTFIGELIGQVGRGILEWRGGGEREGRESYLNQ